MALLTKEQILAADDLKEEIVPCPEWGGDRDPDASVRVVTMDGPTREKFETAMFGKEENERDLMVAVCGFSIHGDNGKLLFTPDEIAALGKKSWMPLRRIFEAGCRVSKLFKERDLEKKSETTSLSAGGSDSENSGIAPGGKQETDAIPPT